MIKVKFNDTTFECARAVKGSNYVRLYDENNLTIVAFEEVLDFSPFIISEGEWEAGKSTQRVVAEASIGEYSFVLTIKEKVVVEDGLVISFTAPSSSKDISAIIIDNRRYDFLTTAQKDVSHAPDGFVEGAKVEIMLSVSNGQYRAYLQNSSVVLETPQVRIYNTDMTCKKQGNVINIRGQFNITIPANVSDFETIGLQRYGEWYEPMDEQPEGWYPWDYTKGCAQPNIIIGGIQYYDGNKTHYEPFIMMGPDGSSYYAVQLPTLTKETTATVYINHTWIVD